MDILDTSALLAFTRKEPGGYLIRKLLNQAPARGESIFMHQINFIEFIYKSRQLHGVTETKKIIANLTSPFFAPVNYMDNNLALFSAYLKANYQLSLGDAIGLAYTKMMEGFFWTADKALLPIAKKENIELELIR